MKMEKILRSFLFSMFVIFDCCTIKVIIFRPLAVSTMRDSDWDKWCVWRGEDRLDSCTLALYTCYMCSKQVLAQYGEEMMSEKILLQ